MVVVCATCGHRGEPRVDDRYGYLVDHPGRWFPCRVPWRQIVADAFIYEQGRITRWNWSAVVSVTGNGLSG